ncbi:TniQ family protein [Dokdonella sp. MW10]|uniref:TniQ family protein n=1 Tax=Dokdonella sp. MW10 TaxID=2992926 RepID=UPI003F7FA65D
MSPLYPLPIQGVGTARIEALSSYLMRLAHMHSVSTALLIQHVCEAGGGSLPPSAILAGPISAVIRPNATTDGLVKTLAMAGRERAQDLECLTMLAISDALHRGMKTYSQYLRWCPGCFADQVKAGTPSYFQLAWQISLLGICYDHAMRLRDRCPHCNGRQDGYRLRQDLARCVKCDGRLDMVYTTDLSTEAPIKDITNLVEHIAQAPGPPVSCGRHLLCRPHAV